MSTGSPRPVGAPQPGQPPPPDHGLWLALAIVAVLVAGAILALVVGVRLISRSVSIHAARSRSGSKEVSIQTPVGDLHIHQGLPVDETTLGLPIYPGALRVKRADSGRVRMDLAGRNTLGVVAAAYETSDPISKVVSFYQTALGDRLTRFTRKDSSGRAVFEVKQRDEEKIAALKSDNGRTRIELVRIIHGPAEAN